MSRYAELMAVEDSAGKTAFQTAVTDISAGALAYDTEPLSTLGRLDPYSPQFQSMTLEKGAMVFHMLRWEMGDDAFGKFLRGLLSQYTDKSIRSADVETVAGQASNIELTAFFAQWIDGTGAPAFADKFTVYRLGNNKGFRTTGAITQDLDLFRMPVELRIETDGKTEDRRVDVSGTDSNYSVETFGRPRKITIDPENWLLKSTPDLAVRVAVLRGQQQVAQGDLTAALVEYQKALDANKTSSLADLPHRRDLLQPAQLSVRRQLLPRRPPRRRRPPLDRSLEPRRARPHLRRHRPARPRRQRVPPGRSDQRQHPGCRQRGTRPSCRTPINANAPTTNDPSRCSRDLPYPGATPQGAARLTMRAEGPLNESSPLRPRSHPKHSLGPLTSQITAPHPQTP